MFLLIFCCAHLGPLPVSEVCTTVPQPPAITCCKSVNLFKMSIVFINFEESLWFIDKEDY